jgi:hypothetical protein
MAYYKNRMFGKGCLSLDNEYPGRQIRLRVNAAGKIFIFILQNIVATHTSFSYPPFGSFGLPDNLPVHQLSTGITPNDPRQF